MFRRRQKSEDAVEQLADDAISADETADDVEGSAESENVTELDPSDKVGLPPAPRPDGPWDHSELENPEEGRVDLGGLLVPGVEGMELRVEVAGDAIVAATLVLGNSAIQLQAFAAPKSEGIWGRSGRRSPTASPRRAASSRRRRARSAGTSARRSRCSCRTAPRAYSWCASSVATARAGSCAV